MFKIYFHISLKMWGCNVFCNSCSYKFCEINGNCIAYHLLYFSLVSHKFKITWECLNVATFKSCEWTNAFF